MPDKERSKATPHSNAATMGALGLLIILVMLTWNAARSGTASLLTTLAAQNSEIAPVTRAVSLNTGDPDAHYVRARILEASDLPAAIQEHYQATLRRPEDFVLWLNLARARELNGDSEGAVAAARQAVPLAPDYAEPHYQLGNILLRAGQRNEAFKELRVAGASNPTLMPGIIDLAWRLSGSNVQFVVAAIEPRNSGTYLMLAQYFAQQGEVDGAIAMYSAAGSEAEHYRRAYVGDLVGAKRFKDAARLWAVGRQAIATGVMNDPGFEEEGDLSEPGFAWRLGEDPQGFHLSLDTAKAREGNSSLKIEFDGASNPASPIITQLVLVKPHARYQLRFAVRSEALVSGGYPRMVVNEADTNSVLAQSDQFPASTDGWHEYTIEFESGPSASAVQIALERQPCERSPCPIFGRLWLDNFTLQRL